MKVLDCPKQTGQLSTNSEDELVRFDVEYLLQCLGLMRKTKYSITEQPDMSRRNLPQPDYLAKDTNGNLAVIEHARFFENQNTRQKQAHKIMKNGFNVLHGLLNAPDPQDLGRRLTEFFDNKLDKGQFTSFANYERILLARNRWSDALIGTFINARPYFSPQNCQGCDHFYLIVCRQLLEVF